MNHPLYRVIESIPSSVAHTVGVSSGLTGLALWSELAKHMTVIAGFAVVILTMLGAIFYAGYWALKMWARWKRIQKGDYAE